MTEQKTITIQQPDNKGLDFAWLKQTGLSDIQRLSGNIWTDYNEHDPGVTTLEQLCYALTELSYRAELPLEDLLMQEGSDEIDSKRQALFRPELILPCNPVTTNDYRKLIVDRIKSVANVWLTPYQKANSNHSHTSVNGLYHILVYAPDVDECGRDGADDPEEIKNKVRYLYNRHRDLCEDVQEITILTPVLVEVTAVVTVTGNQTANIIMANILFNISLLLAPELHKSSLQEKLAKGESADSIIEGPLLLRGLIDDNQLQPKSQYISVNDIVRSILQIDNVANVSNVEVSLVNNKQHFTSNDEIPVPIDEILKLDTNMNHGQSNFQVTLIRNGIKLSIDGEIVKRELNKLWKIYRTSYNLEVQYEKYFNLPSGKFRDLKQYYSFQNQYPDVYGINEYGVAGDETIERHAQAKQLKGYLLVFDQILSNYFSQLAHVKDLYSIDKGIQQSYFYQYLNHSVPDVEPLLKKTEGLPASVGYHRGLPLIIKGQDPYIERRNRFLSVLLAIYGQSLETIYVPPQYEHEFDARLLNAKILWLSYLISGTCNRGRAMDYLAPNVKDNLAGMQIKIRIQLGMDVIEHRSLNQVCSELGVEIVDTNDKASFGKLLETYSDEIEDDFGQLSRVKTSTENPQSDISYDNDAVTQSLLNGQKLTHEFISIAASIENYRLGNFYEQNNVSVLCQSSLLNSEWFFVNKYPNQEIAQKSINILANQVHQLNCFCNQLYLVEHTLLRHALFQLDGEDYNGDLMSQQNRIEDPVEVATSLETIDSDNFIFSFTMTAVVSASPSQLKDSAFRMSVHEAVQQNSPANLLLKYCFISARNMCFFEILYWAWRRALKKKERKKLVHSSIQLIHFLKNNTYIESSNEFS